MLVLSLFAVQAATAPSPEAAKPDIEISARVRARSVEVRQRGEARVVLHAQPDGGTEVTAERSHPPGREEYRNLTVDFHAEARIAAPGAEPVATGAEAHAETGEPE